MRLPARYVRLRVHSLYRFRMNKRIVLLEEGEVWQVSVLERLNYGPSASELQVQQQI
jgi:hypothetical protein